MDDQELSEVLKEQEADRAVAAEAVLGSPHRLRVVVAGPGTGKSFVFREALDRAGGPGLALTFIRKLAKELAEALGDRAETYTFHKYAKMLVYRLGIPGVSPGFTLYPALSDLQIVDLRLLGFEVEDDHVEREMQDLEPTGATNVALQLGTYYDSASFVDVVYRVFRFLESNPDRTPAYPLVVVDEYQDFTRLETAFIAQLGFASPLLIAGDDEQALYDFRFATPDHIRAIADSDFAELHQLPFCSRCPQPVVDAVNAVIREASTRGHLVGRLDKPFQCYLPDKLEASRRYPKLIEAQCTVVSVMARYVEDKIGKIPQGDVEVARRGGHPAAMVIGPSYLVDPIFKVLKEGKYPQATFPHSAQIQVEAIDGYRRIARDERSNLGWRILIQLNPFDGWEAHVASALGSGQDLVDGLPTEYREQHLATASLLGRVLGGDELDEEERRHLASTFGVAEPDLMETIGKPEDPDEVPEGTFGEAVPEDDASEAPAEMTVLCTTLPGAKGLSAEHVFVVGLAEGHLPRDNASPTDKEICEFLVALSRTRTACHLVLMNQFGGPPPGRRAPPRIARSVFAEWVDEHSEIQEVRADRFRTRPAPRVRRATAPAAE